jgi:UDP-N-acetylmuramyl pentapeptide synthase
LNYGLTGYFDRLYLQISKCPNIQIYANIRGANMSELFTAEQILNATSSQLRTPLVDDGRGRIIWDLEELEAGDWFIAIPNLNDDPHDRLDLVQQKGARGVIVNRRSRYTSAPQGLPIITVPDTKVALLDIVRYWRDQVQPTVIGVTGTSGRRSTMLLLSRLLQKQFKTHLALMNNLGWFGCVKEVLAMPEDSQVLIFEAGAVERGDITRIAGALEPDLAILTQVRHPLKSPHRDALAASMYCELLETLNEDGQDERIAAVIYDDNEALTRRSDQVLVGLNSQKYSQSSQSLAHRIPDATLKKLSESMSSNLGLTVSRSELWCAVEAAMALGISEATIEEILELDVVNAGSCA